MVAVVAYTAHLDVNTDGRYESPDECVIYPCVEIVGVVIMSSHSEAEGRAGDLREQYGSECKFKVMTIDALGEYGAETPGKRNYE